MLSCLLLVERGISEPDLVNSLLRQAYRSYFTAVHALAGEPPERGHFAGGTSRPLLADYGLATRISLTGVVLATELADAGLTFEVIDDDDIAGLHWPAIEERLARARMVAISTTYTVRLRTIADLLAKIRAADPEIPVLLGGQGLSGWRLHFAAPTDLYAHLAGADALFFGEAEGTFAELVRRLGARRRVGDIPGAVDLAPDGCHGDGEPVEVDVDRTPLPRWQLLADHDWNDGAVHRFGLPQVAALEEGRGCTFRCKFCSYPLYAGFRRKAPERVTAELALVARAGFPTVSFCGAEFLSPVDRSRLVFEAIAAAALPLEIWAYARLDLVSYRPWIADLMDRANFRFIQFGMESGDRTVLKAMNKNYDPSRMAEGVRMLRQRNIQIYASLVLGYPGETRATLENTLGVLAGCDFDHVILHVLSVVPGSPLWQRRAEYALEVNPQGFWSHPTMSLRDMPAVVRHMLVETDRRTTSLVNNVTQNFANRFFDGTPSLAALQAASRTLQRIAAAEAAPEPPTAAARLALWQRLRPQIDHVPSELVGLGPRSHATGGAMVAGQP